MARNAIKIEFLEELPELGVHVRVLNECTSEVWRELFREGMAMFHGSEEKARQYANLNAR